MNRGEEMKIWDLDLTAASGADKKWRGGEAEADAT